MRQSLSTKPCAGSRSWLMADDNNMQEFTRELTRLSIAVAQVKMAIQHATEATRDFEKRLTKTVEKHEEVLQGTPGNVGLEARIANLEQKEADRKWQIRVVYGALLLVVVERALAILFE